MPASPLRRARTLFRLDVTRLLLDELSFAIGAKLARCEISAKSLSYVKRVTAASELFVYSGR